MTAAFLVQKDFRRDIIAIRQLVSGIRYVVLKDLCFFCRHVSDWSGAIRGLRQREESSGQNSETNKNRLKL